MPLKLKSSVRASGSAASPAPRTLRAVRRGIGKRTAPGSPESLRASRSGPPG
jgi:hypothetical protein